MTMQEPLGVDANGDAVYLRDIWPTREELQEVERRSVLPSMYSDVYQNIEVGDAHVAGMRQLECHPILCNVL
jgi:aconitate hydratase